MRPGPSFLFLLLTALLGAAEPWSGLIEVTESLGGHRPSASDQAELDALASGTEQRLRSLQAPVRGTPPSIARVLQSDASFYRTELERAVLAKGGRPFPLGRTTYRVSGQRLLAVFDRGRLLVDRNRQAAQLMLDAQVREVAPAPLPAELPAELGPGPVLAGRPTRRYPVVLGGRTHECLVDPAVPNVYALAALAGGEADDRHPDLAQELARLPGMPVSVSFDQGRVAVLLTATRIEPGPVPDAVFAPLK